MAVNVCDVSLQVTHEVVTKTNMNAGKDSYSMEWIPGQFVSQSPKLFQLQNHIQTSIKPHDTSETELKNEYSVINNAGFHYNFFKNVKHKSITYFILQGILKNVLI